MRPLAPAPRALAGGLAGLVLLAACSLPGGGGGDGGADDGGDDTAPALGPAETLAALRADAEAVDPEVRRTAPALAEALDGRVRFAAGTTEPCEGGSFDGAGAAGYLVRGRLDPGADATGDAAVGALSEALADQGWDVAEPDTATPDRTVVVGRLDDAELAATVNDDFGQVLFTVAGPCRPVDDRSRDDAIGMPSRQVLPRR